MPPSESVQKGLSRQSGCPLVCGVVRFDSSYRKRKTALRPAKIAEVYMQSVGYFNRASICFLMLLSDMMAALKWERCRAE